MEYNHFLILSEKINIRIVGFCKGYIFLRESARNNKSHQKVLDPA